MKFIWIDDSPDRREGSVNLAASIRVEIEFIDVSSNDAEAKLAAMLSATEPDLIIIDHNLEDIESGIFKKGSTVATYIREQWFECPIISISANIDDVDTQQRALYIDIFPMDNISNYYPNILTIAQSFSFLKGHKPTNTDDLLDFLKPPTDDRINLAAILPTALKNNYADTSLLVEIAQWVKGTLLKRPGFLYDKLWVATLIGVKKESFDKVADLFTSAQYIGVFSNDNEPRWWKSEILTILYRTVESPGYPWVKGRFLNNISEEDFSICHASGEFFPETVAYTDTTLDARQVPIKIKFSDLHPEYESLLNFDEIRVMTPAE